MSWEADLVNALNTKSRPSAFKKNFYIGVYAGGDFVLMGGALRYSPSQQIWTHSAGYYLYLKETEHVTSTGVYYTYTLNEGKRAWRNGMKAVVLLNENDNQIVILDAIGSAGDELNVKA